MPQEPSRVYSHLLWNQAIYPIGRTLKIKRKLKDKKKETTDESSPLLQVRKWIRKRYLKYLTILFNFLRTSSPGLQVTALNILMTLIRVISETRAREEKKPLTFQNVLLLELLAAATHNENLTEHFVKEFKDNYLHRFDDIRYYTLYNLEKLIEDQRSKLRQNGNVSSSLSQETETFVWNVYHILNALNMPRKNNDLKHFFIPLPSNASSEKKTNEKSENSVDDVTKEESSMDTTRTEHEHEKSGKSSRKRKRKKREAKATHKENQLTTISAHRHIFTKCWMSYLKLPLPLPLYKLILVNLHQHVIPYLYNPQNLMDFLKTCYDFGGAISLLALNGLFILISKYNLDYPQFYTKLYSLFTPSILMTKYRARFFKLANTFLMSTHLPTYLVAAFMKRMARLSLIAPPASALNLLVLIHNLLVKHPTTTVLLHRTTSQPSIDKQPEEELKRKSGNGGLLLSDVTQIIKSDPYLFDEEDPSRCNAINSSLWELVALMNHYVPAVATLAKSFQQPPKMKHDVDEFASTSYHSLFQSECKRKIKKGVPLAFQRPQALYTSGDNAFSCWKFGNPLPSQSSTDENKE
jgi:U3 small nucleolar RNA-associated protein 19